MNYSSKLAWLIVVIYSFPLFLYAGVGGGSGESDGSTAPGSGDTTFITALPFVDGENISSLGELVNALFSLALVTGALLAVVKLVIAGATYMLSDVVTKKQSAIASIKGAVLGLLLILSTWLILTQINPDITNSTGVNLPTITVPDDYDHSDEARIEEMCNSEEGCSRIMCFVGFGPLCEDICDAVDGVIEDNTFPRPNYCVYQNESDGDEIDIYQISSDTIIQEYGPEGTDELGEISEDAFVVSCHTGSNTFSGHQYDCSRDSFQEQCSTRGLEPLREVTLDNEQDEQVLVCDSP